MESPNKKLKKHIPQNFPTLERISDQIKNDKIENIKKDNEIDWENLDTSILNKDLVLLGHYTINSGVYVNDYISNPIEPLLLHTKVVPTLSEKRELKPLNKETKNYNKLIEGLNRFYDEEQNIGEFENLAGYATAFLSLIYILFSKIDYLFLKGTIQDNTDLNRSYVFFVIIFSIIYLLVIYKRRIQNSFNLFENEIQSGYF